MKLPQTRRDRILSTAAELFRDRGYHVVAVDELGAAVGISGPAIYKHFSSKQALLVELFDDVTERLLAGARAIRQGPGTAHEQLEALVTFHVDFALEDRTLIAVYLQEERNPPPDDRSRLRRRMRLYTDETVFALRETRPELDAVEARAAIMAAIGLVNSVSNFDAPIGRATLRSLLVRMTLGALASC
jgi:AcrR family transcriptional regulator